MKHLPLAATLALAGGLAGQGVPDDDLFALQDVLQAAAGKLSPSIVTVETFGGTRRLLAKGKGASADGMAPPKRPKPKRDKPKDDEKKVGPLKMPGFQQAQGATTGVVLSADGWILVSRFALNFDPTTILVTLADGRIFNAERKGEDTSRGIALLKVDAKDLPVPEFVPPKEVEVGQWAFALGRTFGRKEPSVHMGVVSATNRLFGRALQIDTYTSPANYGGPVIDVRGRVMGIAVPLSPSGRDAGAELYDSGIGFAATIADIEPLLSRMKKGEVLHRGWLGVQSRARHLGPGAKLSKVVKNSTAAGIGLERGDEILAIDGVPVRNQFHLQYLLGARMAGEAVHLKVRRKDEEFGITAFLAELPESERKAKPADPEAEGELPFRQDPGKK